MKTRLISIFLTCLTLLVTQPASAQGVYIIGNADCGVWIQDRKNNASSVEIYFLGLMNGLAVMTFREKKINILGSNVSGHQMNVWMDKYCQQNPLSTIFAGAFVLVDELTERALGKK